jgi:hypothetical protein
MVGPSQGAEETEIPAFDYPTEELKEEKLEDAEAVYKINLT